MVTTQLGAIYLDVPHRGVWNVHGFPDEVRWNGRTFRKAVWKQPYEGVVEQYREAVPTKSMHMMVRADGTWIIDHIDQDNPDMGRPVEHFFSDHPLGQFIAGAAKVAAIGALVVGVGSLLTKR